MKSKPEQSEKRKGSGGRGQRERMGREGGGGDSSILYCFSIRMG